jgi:hypothetical protein
MEITELGRGGDSTRGPESAIHASTDLKKLITGWARNILISVVVAKKTSVSGRSAECAAFMSEFYLLHKNPTQPVMNRYLTNH